MLNVRVTSGSPNSITKFVSIPEIDTLSVDLAVGNVSNPSQPTPEIVVPDDISTSTLMDVFDASMFNVVPIVTLGVPLVSRNVE